MDQNVSLKTSAGTVPAPVITLLALSRIVVSSTLLQARRRQRYDKSALAELSDNIKGVGVIEPIIVRTLKSSQGTATHEIVAGERRWRATGTAGLDTIPAIVRDLDNQQVLEIQVIENLHREGLHELEEAEGYELLMQQHGYGIEQLIASLGKSRAYIYARIKLLALGKKAREAFYAGTLHASTALLLARIPVPKLQDEALTMITQGYGGQALSYREAQRQIQLRYMLRLKDARFDKTDAALVPTAGACGACPKRTGNQPELFADVKGADVCTDPACFAAKRAAWATRVEANAQADGRTVLRGDAAQRVAPHGLHNLQGGYVALDQPCYQDLKQRPYRTLIGKTLGAVTLLEDTQTGEFVEIVKINDYAATLKDKGVGVERSASSRASNDQRARAKAARIETAWRERVFVAIRAKTPNAIAGADLRLAVQKLWFATPHETRMRLVRICEWAEKGKVGDAVHAAHKRIDTMTESELRRLLLDCALAGEIHAGTWSNSKPEALIATAQRLRIDTGKIRQALKDELAAKAKGHGKPAMSAAAKPPNSATAAKTLLSKKTKRTK